jgi:DUF4097 and DUF4098 domain-containing protein YvlB
VIAVTAVLVATLVVPSTRELDHARGKAPARSQPTRDARAPQTDQTVPVPRDARLLINNFAGEVLVRAGDGDSLRVQARHATRAKVNIRTVQPGIRISSSSERGPTGSVDYEITAPRWLPIKIDGQFTFVTIEGSQAEVTVENVRGDIIIKGGNGITAKSIEGHVTVEGGKGRIVVSSVNDGVAINGANGEIVAETVNGRIALSRIEASTVEAGTINGDITYEGTAAAGGKYRLTTHNGSIVVGVPESASATFAVRTYHGSFNSSLPTKGEGNPRTGRRVLYTLGNGSAEFELESFNGGIRLRRPETLAPPKPKDKN